MWQWARGSSCRCRVAAVPCLAFLHQLGNGFFFHKYRSADGRHLAGVPLAAGTAMPHPSLTLRSICTLLCCRLLLGEAVGLMPGLVACRHEVILPATLMLPRKPEFSFFFAMVWGRSSGQSGAAPSPGAVRRAGVIRFAPALSFLQENILLFHISPIIPHLLPSSISAMFLPRVSWLSRGVWKGANGTRQRRRGVHRASESRCEAALVFPACPPNLMWLHLRFSLQFPLPETH